MEKTIKRICQYCEKEFYIIPSRIKHGRGKHCSPACQYATQKSNSPKAETTWFNCLNCGDKFWLYNSVIKSRKGAGKYCCRNCRDIHRRGKNNPNFIHGNGVNHHGSNWYSQRRKAKKRDNYCCQKCGIEEIDCVSKYAQPLHVHHIIPSRKTPDYQESNQLSNLITLCSSCHRETEAGIQRDEQQL